MDTWLKTIWDFWYNMAIPGWVQEELGVLVLFGPIALYYLLFHRERPHKH